MKAIEFLGNSLERIRDFPADAKNQIGYQLEKMQRGMDSTDWKPMPSIGIGVNEIRIRAADGAFRVIYVAKFAESVYVLNAFQKKQSKTPHGEIDIAKRHFRGISHG